MVWPPQATNVPPPTTPVDLTLEVLAESLPGPIATFQVTGMTLANVAATIKIHTQSLPEYWSSV